MSSDLFTERRKDHWPLCPQCGEDEVFWNRDDQWSAVGMLDKEQLDRLLNASHLGCYNCSWRREACAEKAVKGGAK